LSRTNGGARPRRTNGGARLGRASGGETGAALFCGGCAALVVAVSLAAAIRPRLLFDPEASWALARLLLSLAVLIAAGAAAVASAAALVLWGRTQGVREAFSGLPLPPAALAALAFAAIALGALARFAALDRLPAPLWVDDVSLIPAALSLHGSLADFADPVRASPYGVPAYGSVPVLYLEAYRATLLLFGTTVFGVRFLSAAAGVLSIATAVALGRALLPRGGGTLAGLAVAGMRWHLILSRWAWNAIVVVPLLDVAALLLITGRRRRAMAAVAGAGLLAGLGAHVYLGAWIALAALTAFLLWPSAGTTGRWRLAAAAIFAGTFLLVASPLLRAVGGKTPYFRRAGEHNLLLEIRRQRSAMPVFASAAGALAAPWFLSDPSPWNDLPGRTRLGWILGIPVGAALARALLRRREEVSGFLLTHAGAAFAATVVWGAEMQPNGYRVAYLTTVTGVAAAAGSLSLLSLVPALGKRAAAIGILGLLAISGALAARDVFLRWGPMLEAWEGYQGRDNLLACAALRWRPYGPVSVDPRLSSILASRNRVFFDVLVRYGLGSPEETPVDFTSGSRAGRRFLLAPSGVPPGGGERIVERVQDGRGTLWAVMLGARKADRGSNAGIRREPAEPAFVRQ
jgi:hypothetical protein